MLCACVHGLAACEQGLDPYEHVSAPYVLQLIWFDLVVAMPCHIAMLCSDLCNCGLRKRIEEDNVACVLVCTYVVMQ